MGAIKKIMMGAALIASNSCMLNAQNYDKQNITLLGQWHSDTILAEPVHGIKYQSVWGYEDKVKGKKYAIIGSTSGTYFIEITNPAAPVVRDYVPGKRSKCIWHEYKTYGKYLYAVSDDNPANLQIIDMSTLPGSVQVVHNSDTIFGRSHTIFVDGNKLYCGSPKSAKYGTSRMAVYSLADPTHPVLLRRLEQDYPGDNVHDMFVRNDTVYVSAGYQGLFIYKFNSNNTFSLLAALTNYPDQGYNHSSYLTSDGKTLVFCDEVPAGMGVKSLDVSDLQNISVLKTFRTAPIVTPHNPYIIGNNDLFMAYYQDGLQVYSIKDPANPVRNGYFDTDTLNNASNNYPDAYHGCWGAYVDFGANLILASDMQNGLYVLDASSAMTGINNKRENNIAVRVSPNPMMEKTVIEIGNSMEYGTRNMGHGTFILYDVLGNEVKRTQIAPSGNGNMRVELMREDLRAGIYFYKIYFESGNKINAGGKVVVQ